MAKAAPDDQAAPRGKGQPRAYARAYTPSWIDRFTASVERLPGPSESYYLGIGLIVLLVGLAVLWGEGAVPAGQLYPIHAYLSVTVAYLPALICYLDHRAGAALKAMRPLLEVNDQECNDLHYRLTTLPVWPALLAGLVVFLLPLLVDESRRVAGQPGVFSELGVSTVSYWLTYVLYRLVWWVFGTLIYHTWHQLRLINRIYRAHARQPVPGRPAVCLFQRHRPHGGGPNDPPLRFCSAHPWGAVRSDHRCLYAAHHRPGARRLCLAAARHP
jgi:hypothetical protein